VTPQQRAFLDGFLPLVPADEPVALDPRGRAFVNGFLALAREPAPASTDTAEVRAFAQDFLALAKAEQSAENPTTAFERVVIDRWQAITWRVQGAVAGRFAELDGRQHRLLRALEDTPSLLAPLELTRDERTHSRLLAWALRRPGQLGRSLRRAFLALLDTERPVDDWLVTIERTLGPGCRVDLDLFVPGHWRCLVEVKVDAAERDGQLDDYRALLDDAVAGLPIDGELVFLTVDGRDGETDAAHLPLSFRDLLVAWLPLCLEATPDALTLRQWLVSVATHLYGIGHGTPVATWGFSERVNVLRFLEDAGEAA